MAVIRHKARAQPTSPTAARQTPWRSFETFEQTASVAILTCVGMLSGSCRVAPAPRFPYFAAFVACCHIGKP